MMSKLFERDTIRETAKHLPDPHEVLPRLPDDVTVPDDARALTHGDDNRGRRPATGVRWMRWIPAVVLVVAGAVAAALALRGDTSEPVVSEAVPWTQPTEGPGSNSLAPTDLNVVIPWITVTEGPGSNSLAPTGPSVAVPWTQPTEGPGSNTLAPTGSSVAIPWTQPTEGPGSSTLAP